MTIKTEREYWETKLKIAQFHLALLSAQEDEEICAEMREIYIKSMTFQIESLEIDVWCYEEMAKLNKQTPR